MRSTASCAFASLFVIGVGIANAQIAPIYGRFYRFDVVAAVGQAGVTFISPAPSVNDNGLVALAAMTGAGPQVIVGDGIQPPKIIPFAPNRSISGMLQLNNSNFVLLREAAPSQVFLRRSSADDPTNTVIVASAPPNFDDLWPNPSLNNANEAAFSARRNPNNFYLVTGQQPNFNLRTIPNAGQTLRPMISDDHHIVVRMGANTTDPIVLFDYALSTFETIADSSCFSRLGQSPGITDDGLVVVFYGEPTNMCADMILQTNRGPGIFASFIGPSAQRTIIRIAGRWVEDLTALGGNKDGVCDPGEGCKPGELGFDFAGSPIVFSSFEPDARVSAIHLGIGGPGLSNANLVVSFLGTPDTSSPLGLFLDTKGLWTVSVDLRDEGYGSAREAR